LFFDGKALSVKEIILNELILFNKLFYFSSHSSKNTCILMKKGIHIMLCGIAMIIVACNQPAGSGADKTEGHDKAAEMKSRFMILNDAFNTGNTAAIDTLLSANSEDHMSDTSMPMPKGPAGLKQMIEMMRKGAPDLKSEVKHVAVDGDILIAYGTTTGTHTGEMFGMPPTNKKWSSDFCDVVKFGSDMKMTDHWGVYDEMKMMKDLGMIPSQPPAAAATEKAAAGEKR
jgi:predicted ester cyclase